jgi:hypothetical protein
MHAGYATSARTTEDLMGDYGGDSGSSHAESARQNARMKAKALNALQQTPRCAWHTNKLVEGFDASLERQLGALLCHYLNAKQRAS